MPFKDKEYNRIYQREWARRHRIHKPRIKTGEMTQCLVCKKEFYRFRTHIKKGIKFLCSSKCHGIRRSKLLKDGVLAVSKNFKNTGKTRFKKGVYAGEKHYNWKGGITPTNAKIRNSVEYRNWRESVFARDNWTCQKCGKRGGELNADHIKPFCLYPELRLDITNGCTLCRECHFRTDTFSNRAKNYGKTNFISVGLQESVRP